MSEPPPVDWSWEDSSELFFPPQARSKPSTETTLQALWRRVCWNWRYVRSVFEFLWFLAYCLMGICQSIYRRVKENLRAQRMSDYRYETLSHSRSIRVLSICPGRWTAPLICTLEEVCLNERSEFTAISYTWKRDDSWTYRVFIMAYYVVGGFTWFIFAKPLLPSRLTNLLERSTGTVLDLECWIDFLLLKESSRQILCNGRRMRIQQNLYDCLLQLRKTDASCKYWVDALCIDQQDIPERNRHVLLMTAIYGSARRVIAWLGQCPSLLDSPKTMGRVHLPYEYSHLHNDEMYSLTDFLRLPLRVCARFHLLTRDYFTRTWIVQEYLLPKQISFLIGDYELLPEQMDEVIRMIDNSFVKQLLGALNWSTELQSGLLDSRRDFQSSSNWKLSDYITAAFGHQASDPRDLVFAGIGLITADETSTKEEHDMPTQSLQTYEKGPVLKPDYASDHWDVLVKCFLALMTESGLFALSVASDGSSSGPLPSWMPHISTQNHRRPFKHEIGNSFSAGGPCDPESNILINFEDRQLFLQGHCLDTIAKVATNVRGSTIFDMLKDLPRRYEATSEAMTIAMARTLVANSIDGETPAAEALRRDFVDWMLKESEQTIGWKRTLVVLRERVTRFLSRFHFHLDELEEDKKQEDAALAEARRSKRQLQEFLGEIEPETLQTREKSGFNADQERKEEQRHNDSVNESHEGISSEEESKASSRILTTEQHDQMPTSQDLKQAMPPHLYKLMIEQKSVFDETVSKRCRHRSVFVTKRGYVGVGSAHLEGGDSIMILPGAYVPFAMNSREEDGRSLYRLRGEVYVHGVMHGEVTRRGDWHPRSIVIE